MIVFSKDSLGFVKIISPELTEEEMELLENACSVFNYIIPRKSVIDGVELSRLMLKESSHVKTQVVASLLQELNNRPLNVVYSAADKTSVFPCDAYKGAFEKNKRNLVELVRMAHKAGESRKGYIFSFLNDDMLSLACVFGENEEEAYASVSHYNKFVSPRDIQMQPCVLSTDQTIDTMLININDCCKSLPLINNTSFGEKPKAVERGYVVSIRDNSNGYHVGVVDNNDGSFEPEIFKTIREARVEKRELVKEMGYDHTDLGLNPVKFVRSSSTLVLFHLGSKQGAETVLFFDEAKQGYTNKK